MSAPPSTVVSLCCWECSLVGRRVNPKRVVTPSTDKDNSEHRQLRVTVERMLPLATWILGKETAVTLHNLLAAVISPATNLVDVCTVTTQAFTPRADLILAYSKKANPLY